MISENNATNTTINRKKVLVVDNSALMRRVECDIIGKDSRFVVEDVCSDGLQAYNNLKQKSYDAAIIDVEIPKMTGLELLSKIKEENISVKVIISSTLNKDGANYTVQALAMGAVDFISKPANLIEARGADYEKAVLEALNQAVFAGRSIPIRPSSGPVTSGGKAIAAAAEAAKATAASRPVSSPTPAVSRTETKSTGTKPAFTPRTSPAPARPAQPAKQAVPVTLERGKLRKNSHIGPSAQIKLVAIASSTGGPKALKSVIPLLPANLDAPVVIVQHMPKDFTLMMAQKLDAASRLRVKEAEDGEIIRKGTVYIAPGGYHLNLDHSGSEERGRLSDEPIREGVKPCANYMYESLRSSIYDEITCVVLTGMGADGTAGIRALAENNNVMYTISQNEASCVVYGMPKAVYEAGLVNEVVPLTEVAEAIVKNVGVK